jgi:hypothetical protein
VDDRNPSRAFMIVGVFVALVLALAGAAVLYVYLQPQMRMAENRSMSVSQMQPAQLVDATPDTADEANARAAADRLLAESLNRQATQISQATQPQQVTAPAAQAATPDPAPAAQAATPDPAPAPLAAAITPTVATPYVDAANVTATSPAAAAAQSVADAATTEPQSTGSTQVTSATQVALLQPKAEASVQKNDIPAPPPVEVPKVEVAPPVAPAPATLSADETRRLLGRAAVMIQQGDIASARLILDRLARFGDARAAFALAETFDQRMLAQWNVRGIKGDPTRAKTFYSQAARAGIGEARDRLTELGN